MQDRTIDAMTAAKVEALVEQRERLTLCLLVRFIFIHQRLDLRGKKTTDRRVSSRSQDFRLTDRLPVEADGNVLLHVYYV
jgi:hypothetical protein